MAPGALGAIVRHALTTMLVSLTCAKSTGKDVIHDHNLLISRTWKVPVSILLKLTVPETSPSKWSRFYRSANIALCPLALLYSCKSFMPLDHPIIFLLPNAHFPLCVIAFVMSVFWISTVAGELLNCLAALGVLLHLPSALLGLTVLAWGNSVGDLVADVAVAKAGQPAMAMAGCFAGPMFNMLFGLGTALVIQTADVFPEAYQLHFHTSFEFLDSGDSALLAFTSSLLLLTKVGLVGLVILQLVDDELANRTLAC
ncbi:Cation/calcium exchanger 5 [Sesamum angolense]|uniref:Cation/calcium exchanger 5 n=1 Tax=Sesamum angolense TaxID=2727404 RepID=A0AAE2C2E6_9LAMI|nr:Cation/calcium exchanger 5 [Sesamum angolense]